MDKYKVTYLIMKHIFGKAGFLENRTKNREKRMVQGSRFKASNLKSKNSKIKIKTIVATESITWIPSTVPNQPNLPNKLFINHYSLNIYSTFAENLNRELPFSRKYLQILRDAGFV
ncbi:hypothetical protein [Aequorivita sp. CIP111184]|uniref:hypothetical protein n=1 Tax=Aequorivita sp. CIP111184 TaxID=2211356 RepID=UPI000DBC1D12|nr:hypothetical protein [Aequorivita sp. CIP111184]SRX55368.1 hypothetical protein AEQU1_02390 [Aequorivita sp. CIP111184]